MCQWNVEKEEEKKRGLTLGGLEDLQKRVHDAHGYDDPAHPHVHGCELGRLLRLLVDAVVHEAEGELRDDEDEQQDADDLVGAVELLGLGEMVYCQYKSQTIPLSLFPSFFPADTTDRRK